MGIDHQVCPVLTKDGMEIDFEMNFGEGKYYPGGPKCRFNGKEVDCLTYVSESGGMTGDILIEILSYIAMRKVSFLGHLEAPSLSS